MNTMTIKTTTVEHFQTGSYDDTLKSAIQTFEAKTGKHVAFASFSYAHPSGYDGRWVGILISYEA